MPSTEMLDANQGQNSDLGRPARALSGTTSMPISSMPAPATTAGVTSSVRAIVHRLVRAPQQGIHAHLAPRRPAIIDVHGCLSRHPEGPAVVNRVVR